MDKRFQKIDLDEYLLIEHPAIVKSGLFETYGREIIEHVLKNTESILSTVERWEGGSYQHENGGRESNREHILGMHDLQLEYIKEVKAMCDFDDLTIAIDVHDLGKFIIKDIHKTAPYVERKKIMQKPRERRVALALIRSIKDETLRKKAEEMFERYYNFNLDNYPDGTDITMLITKIFDRVQGFTYGLDVVFLESYNSGKIGKEELFEHIQECVVEIAGLLFILLSEVIHQDNSKKTAVGHFVNTIMTDLHRNILDNYGLELDINSEDYFIGAEKALRKYSKKPEDDIAEAA